MADEDYFGPDRAVVSRGTVMCLCHGAHPSDCTGGRCPDKPITKVRTFAHVYAVCAWHWNLLADKGAVNEKTGRYIMPSNR